MSVCLARQVPTAPPALLLSCGRRRPPGRPPDLLAGFPADLVEDPYYSACPNFKCSSQNFLHGQTPGSSYGALVSAVFVSFVSLTLFWLPSLVRARVASHAQASRVGICPHPWHRLCMSFLLAMSWVTPLVHVLIVMCIILPQAAAFFPSGWQSC